LAEWIAIGRKRPGSPGNKFSRSLGVNANIPTGSNFLPFLSAPWRIGLAIGRMLNPYESSLAGEENLERKIINPWKWQDALGFVQGHEVTGGQRVLYCAGQVSVDAEGKSVHAGDFRGQLNRAIDNLEQVLTLAGFGFSDVVRLNIYTTDLEGFFANRAVIMDRLVVAGCRYSSTLLGVARLARPEFLIEIEATAAK
jgi:enamine deaminase RidA (YjgF/YER057c/UK114 family)